jgi:hypothetical protein
LEDQLRDLPIEEIIAAEPEYTPEDQARDQVVDDAANEVHQDTVFSISSYGADYTADMLVKRMESKAFFVPPFQRSYVWTQRQASRFVESLLLGLPVPGVFVCREEGSSRHLIIDGQQRLKTLQMFFYGVFKERVFRLIDVQERWKGKTYNTLDDDDRQRLDDAVIHTTIFKQDDPNDNSSVFHVFERLNTSGVKLQPQEIRSCIYYGGFIDLLERLNDYEPWRKIFGEKSTRSKDREMILRFLALYENGEAYKRPMRDFLNKFCEAHRNLDPVSQGRFADLFTGMIDLAFAAFGDLAFRPERVFNAAVFDSVAIGLAKRLNKGPVKNPSSIAEAYAKLADNAEYQLAYLRATSDEESVKERIKLAVSAFQDCE